MKRSELIGLFQSNDTVFQVDMVYIQVRIGLIRLISLVDPSWLITMLITIDEHY